MPANNPLNFQHFDQEADIGIKAPNGEWIRKRKKPGRKANPPTAEKKREQNRASQKAYRQRKNEKKKEETKIKQQHVQEIERLKRKLAQSEYEANYLRAIILHLSLTNIITRGCVPHAPQMNNKSTRLPAFFEAFLEKGRIVELHKAKHNNSFSCNSNIADNYIQAYSKMPEEDCLQYSPSPNFSEHESTESEYTLHNDTPENDEPLLPNANDYATQSESSPRDDHQQLMLRKKPLKGILLDTPTFKTADDFIHMSPLQAVQVLSLQLKMGSILGRYFPLSLVPTALQSIVPHDIRIDYFPAPFLRDRMILFQDYYNIDECFQFLTQTLVFTGGDLRVLKNWTIDPRYTEKFWFLSHELIEHPMIC
ncbi:hypothetical protein BY458DRAFT_515357 [Sporodiniella umbellata]|nr:hypothetical protein BY458DRAFT_515357 [Sporodiniella umbellata]